MAMHSDTTEGGPSGFRPGPTPVWVWLLVVAFGSAALFGGYTALSENQLYWESETAREALAHDKSRLEANVSDLKQQLDQANAQNEATANALKQSRADTETASAQIGELQAKANDLESKLAAAEANAKQANAAKDDLSGDLERLKAELADTQKKLAAAEADLARAKQQAQSQLTPPAH
jgi:chromosome segregation ATPase